MSRKTAVYAAFFLTFFFFASAFLPELPLVKAEAKTIVTIRADGGVDGAYASKILRDGSTYTLTDNLDAKLLIKRDNILFDGAGYCIQSPYMGIDLTYRTNVTIRNVQIKAELDQYGYAFGIVLTSSSNNTVFETQVIAPYNPQSEIRFVRGIVLDRSSNNIISANTIFLKGSKDGIVLTRSSNNTISNNALEDCTLGISDSPQNIFINNTIGGRQIIYLQDVSDYIISDAGQVTLVNCDNITVKDAVAPLGIRLANTSNTKITNSTGEIFMENSIKNTISNSKGSITAVLSSGITIFENNFKTIKLKDSLNCLIYANNITSTVENEDVGIELYRSHNSTIFNNTITGHGSGFYLFYCGFNIIYQNNFIDNRLQVDSFGASNYWDNGSIGNYWNNYAGPDINKDGIGDTPNIIDADNQDRYPLMAPLEHSSVTVQLPEGASPSPPSTAFSPSLSSTPTSSTSESPGLSASPSEQSTPSLKPQESLLQTEFIYVAAALAIVVAAIIGVTLRKRK